MLKRKHFLRDGLPYYAKAHVFVSFPHSKSSLPFLYRPPPIPRRPPQLISVVPHQRDSHISRRLHINHQDTLSSEEEKSSPSITISRRCKDVAIELFYCHPLMSRRSRCSIFCQSGVCTLCFTTTRAHGCDKNIVHVLRKYIIELLQTCCKQSIITCTRSWSSFLSPSGDLGIRLV